jgi:hypothetical protein
LQQLRQAVLTSPLQPGYGFATWSAARLTEHLAPFTGIASSDDQIRRLLKQEGFSVHRPKHTLKGKRDETAYTAAKQGLQELNKKPCNRRRWKPWSSRMRWRSTSTRRWRGWGRWWVLSPRSPRRYTTKVVQAWLEANRDKGEIFWLPPYCPSLNLIERLWGHLKRTVLANVLFATIDDLEAAARRGLEEINGRRHRMAFLFNHDDVLGKQTKKAA